ncbi:MAG: hypothetical protein RI894_2640 [Bacteroidota bacterium]|jgi:hypothetical protein
MQPVSYSILYLVLNHAIQDRIAFGCLLTDGQTALLRVSQRKINVGLTLFPASIQHKLKTDIDNLTHDFEMQNAYGVSKKVTIYDKATLEYWATYNTNLLSFSKPVDVLLPLNSNSFRCLI